MTCGVGIANLCGVGSVLLSVYKYSKQEMSDLRVFEKECSAKYRMMKNKQAKEETTERLERLEERFVLLYKVI